MLDGRIERHGCYLPFVVREARRANPMLFTGVIPAPESTSDHVLRHEFCHCRALTTWVCDGIVRASSPGVSFETLGSSALRSSEADTVALQTRGERVSRAATRG
jgi:hypothetical protein